MSLVRRWRRLKHQTRVTLISTVASTLVLGLVLLITSVMLVKSATDTALKQTHDFIQARLDRDATMTLDDLNRSLWRAHDRRQEELNRESNDHRGEHLTGSPDAKTGPDGKSLPTKRPNGHGPDERHSNDHPTPGQDAKTGSDGKGMAAVGPGGGPGGPGSGQQRPHMAFARYGNDGKPFPGIPAPTQQLNVDGKEIPWPQSLDAIDFPPALLHFVANDELGRFKVLCTYDLTDQLTELRRLQRGLFILWPVLVAILAVTTYLAVGSSFQPLHKLLQQAKTLGLDDRMATADKAEFGDLAASINSYLDRIEKVVQQQEEFAVDAAHELCTPLTALRGQLELALLQKKDPEAFAAGAKNAINQVTRLERLVESLLLATRPRDGAIPPCDVQQTLEEVQARWVDRYAARQVELQLAADAFTAAMPEEEIESVMENLLANALKFSPPGTTVRITLDAKGHLVVQDQGPGIPEADRERIFERFERGTSKARGFGIGLYLVRRLLEQRGGNIRIGDSSSGARVEVALPA